MTLGNMRANGVRTLDAWCLGRDCHHHRVLDVSAMGDDIPVPSIGPRLGASAAAISAPTHGRIGQNTGRRAHGGACRLDAPLLTAKTTSLSCGSCRPTVWMRPG